MTKQIKKIYISKAILLTTSILAILSIYIFNTNQLIEPLNKLRITPKMSNEQAPNALANQQALATYNTVEDNEIVDESILSIDALRKMLFPEDDVAWAWAKVDIDRLQTEMPDNLYWQLAAPTSDTWLLEHRKEIKAHWDNVYGQILSNKASEQQIRDYYAHQHQVSTDYVIFATQLLNRHIKDLPERDVSFQKLARNLHLARLEELPKKLTNAINQRNKQEERRAAWLADKAAFEDALRIEKEDAERLLKPS